MAIDIKIEGNYIFLTNSENDVVTDRKADDISIVKKYTFSQDYNVYYKGGSIDGLDKVPWDNFTLNGVPFDNQESFETWRNENTNTSLETKTPLTLDSNTIPTNVSRTYIRNITESGVLTLDMLNIPPFDSVDIAVELNVPAGVSITLDPLTFTPEVITSIGTISDDATNLIVLFIQSGRLLAGSNSVSALPDSPDVDHPEIIGSSINSTNTEITISFNEGVYNFDLSDVSIVNFNQNGDSVQLSDININSITKTDGNPLVGGETEIRVNIDTNSVDSTGLATFQIQIVGVEDLIGNSATLTTGDITLNNQVSVGDLVTHLDFQGDLLDTSGNNNNPTGGANVTFITDGFKVGVDSAKFDGTIGSEILTSINIPQDFTVMCHVKWTGVFEVFLGMVGNIEMASYFIANGDLYTKFQSPNLIAPNVGVSGDWLFYSMTYDSATKLLQVKVNGSPFISLTQNDLLTPLDKLIVGGFEGAGADFNGEMYSLRMYNEVKSEAFIEAIRLSEV